MVDLSKALHEEGIAPNAEAIARINLAGGLPVLVFQLHPSCRRGAKSMGWTGEAVFELSPAVQKRLARADPVTRRWVQRKGTHRLFVLVHFGSLLLNFTPGEGWDLEPGSFQRETTSIGFRAIRARAGHRWSR